MRTKFTTNTIYWVGFGARFQSERQSIEKKSICMSHCGAYYLKDELGYFLNYISDENDSLNLEYYLNRFVNIEGDSISCTEYDWY